MFICCNVANDLKQIFVFILLNIWQLNEKWNHTFNIYNILNSFEFWIKNNILINWMLYFNFIEFILIFFNT